MGRISPPVLSLALAVLSTIYAVDYLDTSDGVSALWTAIFGALSVAITANTSSEYRTADMLFVRMRVLVEAASSRIYSLELALADQRKVIIVQSEVIAALHRNAVHQIQGNLDEMSDDPDRRKKPE